jgi:hypothetical protein
MAPTPTAPHLFALTLAASLLPAPAPAQTDARAPAIAEALAEAGTARPLLRCTALFRALRVHPASNEATVSGAALRETALASTAAIVWQDETGVADTQAAFDALVPMIGAASRLYRARISRNVEATGGQFDAALRDDLIYCDALHAGIAAPRGD